MIKVPRMIRMKLLNLMKSNLLFTIKYEWGACEENAQDIQSPTEKCVFVMIVESSS